MLALVPVPIFQGLHAFYYHQKEEGHRRGDEVGIGNFPGTTMVSAAAAFYDFLDDNRLILGRHVHPPCF